MSSNEVAGNPYDETGLDRIKALVEKTTGGKIVRLEQQARWRPAWFADVEMDGTILPLHLRGNRVGDVAIFPDLKREADIINVLHRGGVPVPRIHGYCADPPCIIMDSLPGTRDVHAATTSDDQRREIGRALMNGLAVMHQLPLDSFAAIGIETPDTPEEIALVGLRAYMPLYQRTKSKPEPLLEFVIRWLERNYPRHRARASFVQFDCGQFLVEDGRMTGFYDFEFGLVSDPHVDLATLAMRDSVEPMGRPLPELFRCYEEAMGEPVDHDIVQYYIALFSTLGTMQFAGTVGKPAPGDPHAVYLSWDMSLRKCILLALSKLLHAPFPDHDDVPITPSAGKSGTAIAALVDTIRQVRGAAPIDTHTLEQALELAEWIERDDRCGDELRARDHADISAYLKVDFADIDDAVLALERHVQQAPAEEELALFTLLARLERRRQAVFEPVKLGVHSRNVIPIETR
ncbi:phosphotransferase [Sphingobium sp. CFD-1]|uniref:phosphotransferase n=1 Tax=Sphingobium sp. CFD-1 TaxID=2878545 RepID=UPI00214B3D33|nr:phosphotransferase [Sphingobium sp. CFD-1]